jgi:tRNA-specific 2-thiouridylase
MSGGVDSSVAALLMLERGFACTGAMMKLFSDEDIGANRDRACCSLADAEDARAVANRLNIPFHVFNLSDYFKRQVIERFIVAYQNGETPNPCIDCNRWLKFDQLLRRARELDHEYLVTGHYARIEYNTETGRYLLKKALDETKDQSYVLYAMTQEQLAHTLFPLGELTKAKVREIADRQGFVNAKKRDSQDICFVRDGDYAGFIERYTGQTYEEGDFIDRQGNVLGRHKGLIRYTIGQRKGLGLALEKPLYVWAKNIHDNTVTLCEDSELYTKSCDAADFNWLAVDGANEPLRVKAKVRYKHTEQWATATQTSPDTVHIEFDEPQRAIAKGQAAVLYDGEAVVGGGRII